MVLAGGSNARFGGAAKGLFDLGGRRVVDWTLEAVSKVTDELLLITNDAVVRAALPEVAARADARPERGSLVGVHSALSYCNEAALVVGWDMPFLSPELLRALRHEGEKAGAAAIPEGSDGLEPLCAYYPKPCLDVAERQLARGEMRLSAFVASLSDKIVVGLDAVRRFGVPERMFANLNTAVELEAARSLVRDGHRTLELTAPSETQ
jgi:molybdopterin-guanine dinucleotide biosynthesis protein A